MARELQLVVILMSIFRVMLCLLAVQAMAADPPRIGLVLGGGGALGLAHVGVIEWLEDQRIPVRIVTGTSMGGLVGGLYATGRNAGELREFVAGIDWDAALRMGPSFEEMNFRRREDAREFPSQLRVGVNQGIKLPAGLSPGHGVGMVLSRFTGVYGDVEDFDQLPIPFACVATDLVKGEKVVFRKGRMFDALRSTMAIPGLFTPWKLNGRVLVDGGTLDNLPVGAAREMGADVVIAVVLETPPISDKAVESLLGIAGRTIGVMIANNEKASMGQADVIVTPVLKGFTSTDYAKSEALRKAGYEAARKMVGLKKYALGEEEWKAYLAERQARRRDAPQAVAKIRVTAVEPKEEKLLEGQLERGIARDDVKREQMERSLAILPGGGLYDAADYQFVGGAEGKVLEVRPRLNQFGRWSLSMLPQFDVVTGEGSRFGLGGRIKALGWGGPASELRVDLLGGAGNNMAAAEYYWRPSARRFFVAPRIGLEDQRIPFRKDGRLLAELGLNRKYAEVAAGLALNRKSEARIGVRLASTRAGLASGTLPVADRDGTASAFRMQYRYLGQDQAQIARRGIKIAANGEWVALAPGNVSAYATAEGTMQWAKPLGDRWSLLGTLGAGVSPNRSGAQGLFTLGGINRLSALSRNQLFGHRYYLAQGGVLRQLQVSSFATVYGAVMYEGGATYLRGFDAPIYQNGSMGVMAESYLGIVYLGVGIGDKGGQKVFLRVGRIF